MVNIIVNQPTNPIRLKGLTAHRNGNIGAVTYVPLEDVDLYLGNLPCYISPLRHLAGLQMSNGIARSCSGWMASCMINYYHVLYYLTRKRTDTLPLLSFILRQGG
jgi:hypothetical protein